MHRSTRGGGRKGRALCRRKEEKEHEGPGEKEKGFHREVPEGRKKGGASILKGTTERSRSAEQVQEEGKRSKPFDSRPDKGRGKGEG